MKVAPGENVFSIGKDQRVVGCRASFDLNHLANMDKRTACSSVHLWHAAQTIGILHARIIVTMRFAYLAFSHQITEMRSHLYLPRMWTRGVNALIESCRSAA